MSHTPPLLLNRNPDMVERMEDDLREKAALAYANVPDLEINVYGVFSLDHLETMLESDLCNGVGVGVGYAGSVPVTKEGPNLNTDRGSAAATLEFSFVIVLAVPTEESCGTRHNATKLLSLLRAGILGRPVGRDTTNRTWVFVGEKPEISASTKSMLYYSQVWQIALPTLGNVS